MMTQENKTNFNKMIHHQYVIKLAKIDRVQEINQDKDSQDIRLVLVVNTNYFRQDKRFLR